MAMLLRTGLFGGSFNPIHNGHIRLARHLLVAAKLDEVWFMVSPQNPFKQHSNLLDDEKRLELVRLALADEPHMKACDYEFLLPRPSYTWNTLQHLKHDYPEREFTLLMGGDNWANFSGWSHAEDIVKNYKIVVYPRTGSTIDKTLVPPTVTIVDTPFIDISSTGIRQCISMKESIYALVPEAVERRIQEEGLYAVNP